jgi:transcription elongation GreA/GreB family factor
MSTARAYDGEVEVGERVTLLDLTTAAVRDYRIGRGEASLDAALLGRHVGDVVELESGRFEIVEIDG